MLQQDGSLACDKATPKLSDHFKAINCQFNATNCLEGYEQSDFVSEVWMSVQFSVIQEVLVCISLFMMILKTLEFMMLSKNFAE